MPPAKPIHPSTVHFPIAFLALAFSFDIVYHLSDRLPKAVTNQFPPYADLTRFSFYLLSIGLFSTIPAVVTGVREAVVSVQKQGLWEEGEKNKGETTFVVREKFKAMIAHAVIQDAVLIATATIWYQKRNAANNSLAGKVGVGSFSTGAAAYAPTNAMVIGEAILLAMIAMGGNIGHVLAFNFGMGLSVGGGKKKQK